MNHQSCVSIDSRSQAGVVFTIRKMSVGRRAELMRRLRELFRKIEFLEAGDAPAERIEAALLATEVDQLYLLWGLAEVTGLEIDGQPATAETLVAAGPEELCREIVAAVKGECGLTDEERKN